MKMDALIHQLGKDLGQGELTLKTENGCTLTFEGGLAVSMELSDSGKVVHLYAELCDIPDANKEKLFEKLLEIQVFGYATGGASFGIIKDTGKVILYRNIELEHLHYEDFYAILEFFIELYRTWYLIIAHMGY